MRGLKAACFATILLLVTPAAAWAAGSEETAGCGAGVAIARPNVTVLRAQSVPAGRFRAPDGRDYPVRRFCRVEAVARPTPRSEINIEIWLPDPTEWNGRFYQHGEGGSGGSINYRALADRLERGSAVAATDDGIRRNIAAAADLEALYRLWEGDRHNPEQVIDNHYRAMIETTHGAKALLRLYYPGRRFRSYFAGCSGGGNYALKAVQRMPGEWDGVLVGAPSNNATRYFIANIWNSRRWLDPATRLRPETLPAVQRAALASCGPRALVVDGIATDPRHCRFDPAVLQCAGAATGECLTAGEVATLRLIYSGPRNPRTGAQLYPGFPATGEAAWPPFLVAPRESRGLLAGTPFNLYSANVFLQYLHGSAERAARLLSFDFDRDVESAESLAIAGMPLAEVYNSTAVDLSAFARNGGRIIMYFGWQDPALTPLEGIAYYEQVARAAGGMRRAQDFFRLFMVPGMAHCGGGPGANAFGQVLSPALRDDPVHDVSRALEAWVEQRRPPDHLVAARFRDDLPANGVAFTRRLCPYPSVAVQGGAGDPRLAASFRCRAAA